LGWLGSFYGSTIGKKVVMALTGLVLVGYLVVHVTGNLLMFRGPEAINRYAAFLKSSAVFLWTVRVLVFGSLLLHVHAAWKLTLLNRAARPARYARRERRAATWSALSLRVGGVVLLAFFIFHILHFTTGTVHPRFDVHDVYRNVIIGLRVPAVAGFYLVAMIALGLHLHHGFWSLFQTIGLNHPHVNPVRRILGTALALLVPLGFILIVLAVLLGRLR
jgi:succinate dehydrogenase / fumarate reductase cytochrome b subunit